VDGVRKARKTYRYIIQHQEGLIHVMRDPEKSGDAESFCSLTAAIAIEVL